MLTHSLRRVLSFPVAYLFFLIVNFTISESGILSRVDFIESLAFQGYVHGSGYTLLIALQYLVFVFMGVLVCPHNTRNVIVIFSGLGLVCSGSALMVLHSFRSGWPMGIAAALALVVSVVLGALAGIKLQDHRLRSAELAA